MSTWPLSTMIGGSEPPKFRYVRRDGLWKLVDFASDEQSSHVPSDLLPPKLYLDLQESADSPQKSAKLTVERPVGDKITVCVCLYGPEHTMHLRCLNSILRCVPEKYLDLRVATNGLAAKTVAYLEKMPVTVRYDDGYNMKKALSMRKLLHDPVNPIKTAYVLWLDDEAWIKTARWLPRFASLVDKKGAHNVGVWAEVATTRLDWSNGPDPRDWFKRAAWFEEDPFRTSAGECAPNADCIVHPKVHWAIFTTDAINDCDLPDYRVVQKGIGPVIGAALASRGWAIEPFNEDGQLFGATEGVARGYTERCYPWETSR